MSGIDALKELLIFKIHALEKLNREQHESLNMALNIQAKEYERRLGLLNGEAERLRQMQITYLPRELYETQHKELEKIVDELRLYRANVEGKASQREVFIAWGIGFIGIVIGIISLIG